MRLSRPLYKQNVGWHFKTLWATQGALKVANTGVEKMLTEQGVPVVKSEDILKEKREFVKVNVVGFKPKPIVFNKTHPDWHERTLLTYRDNNVLLEGLVQAKILTNTVEIKKGLPESLRLTATEEIDSRIKEIILTSHVFDAEQKKLPKIKDPNRPAWNFPRIYGITQERVVKLLIANLLQSIETTSEMDVVKRRSVIDDLLFSYNFEKFGDLIQFTLKADSLLTSVKPLDPPTSESTHELELPNISPIKPTITLTEENIYQLQNIYPVSLKLPKSHPHTLFVHHDETQVKNIFEEEVTESQIFARSLLKTFTVAASYAQKLYGNGAKILPEPVTLQCVQTNGRLFHFGMLQLNTLDLENSGVKNIWYQTGRIPLFDCCHHKVGRPVLEGYNSEVIKFLNTFYNNG